MIGTITVHVNRKIEVIRTSKSHHHVHPPSSLCAHAPRLPPRRPTQSPHQRAWSPPHVSSRTPRQFATPSPDTVFNPLVTGFSLVFQNEKSFPGSPPAPTPLPGGPRSGFGTCLYSTARGSGNTACVTQAGPGNCMRVRVSLQNLPLETPSPHVEKLEPHGEAACRCL